MRKALRHIRSLTTVALSTVVAVALSTGSASAQSLQPVTVQLDWLPHSMHASFHLASLKGWYKDAGLAVTFKDGSGSAVAVQVVASGNFDIGHANLATMAMARGKGLPVRAVAGFMRKSDMGLLVPASSNIMTAGDLAGKKIIYTAGSLEGPFVDAFLKGAGLSRSKVELLSVSASAKLSTYIAKQGDAVMTTVPFMQAVTSTARPSRGILFADVGLPLPGFGLFATEKTIQNKPEIVQTFVATTIKAWEYILDGHEAEGIDAIIKERPGVKIDHDLFLRGLIENAKFFTTKATENKPFGWMAPTDWDSTTDAMVDAGVVPKGVKSTDFYTNRFVPEG